ncbi:MULTISPECIES: DUF317 domain-containing protein [unclassified Kitasatospora]|uniref:DUF317 domain-containing protein n=1 Tax=unclassified Kitasatospora TaxID=2633591 RepID=UPI0007092534|nr:MULTISPECIES: DUF317 domain-containing protein [unclassified Kitasatospora]KQV20924.1 hypothetical protein ASC99_20690 [Kitasatospora sp. Root107]KRB60422.1 hypothetical protein ASE03_12490 [Kitasatospora sp. Root187]
MDSTTSPDRSAPARRPRRPAESEPRKRVTAPLPGSTWYHAKPVGVRPAYLALGTYTSLVRARRVLQAASWTRTDQGKTAAFTSGDLRVLLHESTDRSYQREVLTAHGPSWRAVFSAQTPDEVLASAAEALVEVSSASQDGTPDPADRDNALYCLAEAGWEGADAPGDGIARVTSPDRLAEVLCHPGGRAWLITVGMDGEGWEAELVGDCPEQLVEAVVGSLAAESPVRRFSADLPNALRRFLDVGPDPDRTDTARGLSPAARVAGAAAPVVTHVPAVPAPARRSR